MNKKEFLKKLYNTLYETISDKEASSHVNYYQAYIEEQVSKGRKEKEVIEELGNPRLIAKTIIETGASSNYGNSTKYSDTANYYEDVYGSKYNREDNIHGSSNKKKGIIRLLSNLTWKQKLKLFAVLALIFLLIGLTIMYAISIVITFIKLIIKFIVPISIIVGGYYIYKIIKE